jgi:hypothetical protein
MEEKEETEEMEEMVEELQADIQPSVIRSLLF